MSNAETAAQRFLKAPRVPRACPVTILHVQADNDRNGNPRRCFAVLTPRGRLVEVHDEDYNGSQEVVARWPWFNHLSADVLNIETAYMVTVRVAAAEYKRWIRQGESVDTGADELPELRTLRQVGDRCERWSAVRTALETVRRDGQGVHPLDGERSAIIYHRTLDAGGDETSVHLARAMAAFARAGWVSKLAGNRLQADTFGRYQATATTPRV